MTKSEFQRWLKRQRAKDLKYSEKARKKSLTKKGYTVTIKKFGHKKKNHMNEGSISHQNSASNVTKLHISNSLFDTSDSSEDFQMNMASTTNQAITQKTFTQNEIIDTHCSESSNIDQDRLSNCIPNLTIPLPTLTSTSTSTPTVIPTPTPTVIPTPTPIPITSSKNQNTNNTTNINRDKEIPDYFKDNILQDQKKKINNQDNRDKETDKEFLEDLIYRAYMSLDCEMSDIPFLANMIYDAFNKGAPQEYKQENHIKDGQAFIKRFQAKQRS